MVKATFVSTPSLLRIDMKTLHDNNLMMLTMMKLMITMMLMTMMTLTIEL